MEDNTRTRKGKEVEAPDPAPAPAPTTPIVLASLSPEKFRKFACWLNMFFLLYLTKSGIFPATTDAFRREANIDNDVEFVDFIKVMNILVEEHRGEKVIFEKAVKDTTKLVLPTKAADHFRDSVPGNTVCMVDEENKDWVFGFAKFGNGRSISKGWSRFCKEKKLNSRPSTVKCTQDRSGRYYIKVYHPQTGEGPSTSTAAEETDVGSTLVPSNNNDVGDMELLHGQGSTLPGDI